MHVTTTVVVIRFRDFKYRYQKCWEVHFEHILKKEKAIIISSSVRPNTDSLLSVTDLQKSKMVQDKYQHVENVTSHNRGISLEEI